MSKLLDYLLSPQTAVVFDIDGVLCVYEFGERCHSACPDEDWERYVLERDPYAHIRPVRLIQELVSGKDPSHVFACSVAQDFESEGKRDFVLRNYQIPEQNVRIVSSRLNSSELNLSIISRTSFFSDVPRGTIS